MSEHAVYGPAEAVPLTKPKPSHYLRTERALIPPTEPVSVFTRSVQDGTKCNPVASNVAHAHPIGRLLNS
jgi:hypothetical protein